MTNRRTVSETVSVEPFKLVFPPELDIKPKWIIDLPEGHKAEVYAATGKKTITYTTGYAEVDEDYHVIVVRNKKGIIHPRWGTARRTDHFSVRELLELVSAELTPKTRKRTERDDYED